MRVIDAIVPAYNEAPYIGAVLEPLKRAKLIREVIVVDDGSGDDTARVAREAGARVIRLSQNAGKSAAMRAGAEASDAPYFLFIDADLTSLTSELVDALAAPVAEGAAESTLGIFVDGRPATDAAQRISPGLSGQRVVPRGIFSGLRDIDGLKFGVEIALNKALKAEGIEPVVVRLPGMSQVTKEEKLGRVRGILRRAAMYKDIVRELGRR